jgi:flagellar protein FlaG
MNVTRATPVPGGEFERAAVKPEREERLRPKPVEEKRPVDQPTTAVELASTEPILRNLSVRMDPETNKVVVKVIDAQSGKVVREIPPDELARIDRDLGPRPGRLVQRKG